MHPTHSLTLRVYLYTLCLFTLDAIWFQVLVPSQLCLEEFFLEPQYHYVEAHTPLYEILCPLVQSTDIANHEVKG